MRHQKTKKMLQYWMGLWQESGMMKDGFGRIVWPERNAIQPMQCAELLGDMFILDITNGSSNFRLAGTRLCALMGRELKGEAFAETFIDEDHRAAESWATGLTSDEYHVLICSDGYGPDGRIVPLETLIMPLNHEGMRSQRALGITVPLEMPSWLPTHHLVSQTIRSVRILKPWEDAEFTGRQHDPKSFTTLSRKPNVLPSPSIETDIDTDQLDIDSISDTSEREPLLIGEDGRVRGAPFLRVLSGGKD